MSDNREFELSLERATLKIIEQVTSNMKKACLVVERDAKKDCPVDQGQLRASIKSDVTLNAARIEGKIGSNLEYAPYLHNGTGIYAKDGNGRKTPWFYLVDKGKYKGGHWTRGQRPNPFLEKAKLKNKDRISEILAGKLNV